MYVEGIEEEPFVDDSAILLKNHEEPTDAPSSPYHKEAMSDEEWEQADAAKMAAHISMGAPETDYAKETRAIRKSMNPDKLSNFWLDRIDSMDPALGQDLTSEFMNVQKTQSAIKNLEAKLKAEANDWSAIDQYNTDKMLLENYQKQLKEDSEQTVALPEMAYQHA